MDPISLLAQLPPVPRAILSAVISLLTIVSMVVALLPQKYHDTWWAKALRFVSALVHATEPGTLKIPLSNIVLNVKASTVIVLLALSAHVGCAGAQRPYTPPDDALVGIHLASHGVALTDGLVAPGCRVASPAPGCARFVTSYGASRASLLVLEQGARQWRQASDLPSQCHATVLMRNAYADVITLQAALDSLHIAYPHDLVVGAQLIAGLIATNAPACPNTDGGTP